MLASLLAVPGATGPACRAAGGTRPASAVKPTRRRSRWVSFRQAIAGVCCAPNADFELQQLGRLSAHPVPWSSTSVLP